MSLLDNAGVIELVILMATAALILKKSAREMASHIFKYP